MYKAAVVSEDKHIAGSRPRSSCLCKLGRLIQGTYLLPILYAHVIITAVNESSYVVHSNAAINFVWNHVLTGMLHAGMIPQSSDTTS